MVPIPEEFPVDANGWRACVRGSGDEVQSWTCGRDVGRAVVELCRVGEWVSFAYMILRRRLSLANGVVVQEPVTYVAGEWSTFNEAIKVMEEFYGMSSSSHPASLCFMSVVGKRGQELIIKPCRSNYATHK